MSTSMRLFKRGKVYWVEYERHDRQSLKTKDKAKALIIYNQLKRKDERKKKAQVLGESSLTLGSFAREYLEWSKTEKSPNTHRADRLALDKLLADNEFGADILLAKIDTRSLEKFMGRLKATGIKEVSRAVYYRHLRAAFSKAVRWKYLEENPFRDIKEPRSVKKEPRFLSAEEIDRFMAAETDPHFKRFWKICQWTGLRRQEVLSLTWAHINLVSGHINVTTKGGQRRAVAILPPVAKVLAELKGHEGRFFPWHPDTVSHHFKKTAGRAGLQYRLHDLRHTFASYLVMSGNDLKTVQHVIGHKDIKATQIYAHLSQNHLDAAMSKLRFADNMRTIDDNPLKSEGENEVDI